MSVPQREEAFLRAQKEAERKRQERELLHLQEEQERLQRKKVLRLRQVTVASVAVCDRLCWSDS